MAINYQSNGLLLPFSMEPRNDFVARYLANPRMTDLFPDSVQRREMAEQVFADIWEDAQVRVTKLDGTMFFID